MEEERRSHAVMIAVAAALLLALPAMYVGGYFGLSTVRRGFVMSGQRGAIRVFPADELAQLFWPMTKVESMVTGDKVLAGSRGK